MVYLDYMEPKNKCNHCGSFENVFVYTRKKVGDKSYPFYRCRKCNTEKMRKYYQTETGRANIKKAVSKSIEKYRDKQNARALMNYHLKVGHLTKPENCSVCKTTGRIEGHHNDYSKPLDVRWLCRGCHVLADKNII